MDRYFKALANGKVYDFLQRRMPRKTISFFISAMVEGKDSLGPIRSEEVDGVFRQVQTHSKAERPPEYHQSKRPVVGAGGGMGED